MFYSTLVNNYLGNWNTVTEGQIIDHEARKKPLLLKIKDGEYNPGTRCELTLYDRKNSYIYPDMVFIFGEVSSNQENKIITIVQMLGERYGNQLMRYI